MNRKRKSDWAKVNKSREVRLWIATIISMIYMIDKFLDAHPEVRFKLRDKWDDIANRYRKNPEIRYYPPKNN